MPMPETAPAVYTLADLIQDTARIMAEIEEAGKPAFITRRGRFAAVIRPLAPGEIEAPVLAAMAREIGAQLADEDADFADEWDDAESNAYQDRVEAGLEQEDSSDGK